MDDLKEKEKSLIKEKRKVSISIVICYFLTYMMYVNKDSFLLFIKAVLSVFKIELYLQELIMFVITNGMLALPVIIIVTGNMTKKEIEKEIYEIKEYRRMHPEIKDEVNIPEEILNREMDELKNIVYRFEKLPRDKQMEILNFIKGYFTNDQDNIYDEIDSLSDYSINILQNEIEEVLFPDFEKNKDKIKKR